MALLTAVQVADYWVGAGGPRSRAVEWVAIAMGESGLNDDAVSPAGAIGTWQIMPFNAPPYGYSPSQLYDPAVNARIAVAMSGHGVNCAAWDSCYADIYRSGRYSFLAWPEQGSADYNNLPAAAAEIGGSTINPAGDPGSPAQADPLPGAIAAYQAITGKQLPAVATAAARATGTVSRMYR